jgi:hypothetical protein
MSIAPADNTKDITVARFPWRSYVKESLKAAAIADISLLIAKYDTIFTARGIRATLIMWLISVPVVLLFMWIPFWFRWRKSRKKGTP